MAADPASRHNCAHCSRPLEGFVSLHVCRACGQPQPLAGAGDHFAAFGLPRRFGIDRALLEQRFYEISRALHPDRFAAAAPQARSRSLERMSLLNEAYRTLKDPATLRRYFLELEGLEIPQQIPYALAEAWFELQETLSEDPGRAGERLAGFGRQLAERKEQGARTCAELENAVDQALEKGAPAPRDLLERLAREVGAQNYLGSMEKDYGRLRGRFLAPSRESC